MSHLNRTGHLNEEQFSALLGGEISGDLLAAQTHLDACAECRDEMERVAGAMESFSGLALEWAEMRSATLPAVAAQPRAAWVRPAAWAGVTAALGLGIIAGLHPGAKPAAQPETAQMNAPAAMPPRMVEAPARSLTREQQIAEDNRMLLAIRQELTQPETLTLGISEGQGARAARTLNN